MGIKRIIGLALTLAVVIGGMVYLRGRAGDTGGGNDEPLRMLTWSNYYPDKMLADFTQKTGIKVELSYMSSNEELFAKLRAGATGFDLIQPSDYMVRRMAELKMLAPLNHAYLTNLSHLDPYYTNLPYDPGMKFSVPFTWGTTGIAVNTAKVRVPPGPMSWKFLFQSPDPKHTSLLDDMREVFAGVLAMSGVSINTTDVKALEDARGVIQKTKNQILTFTSETKPLLLKEEIAIAHVYSCDAVQAAKENPKIKYFIPLEGGTIWTDNFAIPSTSRKQKEAHAFMDYFLDPKNALDLIQENVLATPNKTARLQLSEEERNDPSIYPPKEVLDKMQFLQDIGDTLPQMNRMWTELKS